MSLRFVILHHRVTGGEHWDLMLEQGEVLLTWQLEREPIDRAALPILARRIGDHRKAYLDYQGPLSGARGEVRRVDHGWLKLEEIIPNRCVLYLKGERLVGRFSLTAANDEWIFDALRENA